MCRRIILLYSCAVIVGLSATVALAQPQVSNGEYVVSAVGFEDRASATNRHLVRTNPGVGEGVIGIIDQNNQLILSDYVGGQLFAGYDLQSEAGLLSRLQPAEGDESPFDIVIADSPNRVSVGNLGVDNRVELGARAPLNVAYTGERPEADLRAVWGRGVEEVPFPVTRFGEVGYTPWNLTPDGDILRYANARFSAVIEAGSATGTPPDSPADRVDPNDATAEFSGVGSFSVVHPTLGEFICSGSVIDDNKILTAAHCWDQDSDGALDAGIVTGSSFFLNDGGSPSSTFGITGVAIHPDFDGFAINGGHDDFAVVTLDSAVPAGTTQYRIRNTGMSASEVVEMVGYGISGHGDVGGIEVLPDFNVKRSGKNEADLFVTDDEGGSHDEVFIYDFDGPTGVGFLGGGTLGNDIETVVRGGDSGGPAFVDESGTRAIAGIASFELVLDGITSPTGEFGVLGGGPMIDDEKWMWIKENAPGARLVPEPSGFALCVPLLIGLLLRKRR